LAKLRKRSAEGSLVVEGYKLHWTVHREPQWSTADGWKGLSIAVQLEDGKGRELILEYPYPKKGRRLRIEGKTYLVAPNPPVRPAISAKTIEGAIVQAIAAGWKPASRGKAFAFQVPENSN
jgi:hypothetical protein